jgi:hypothetical protein
MHLHAQKDHQLALKFQLQVPMHVQHSGQVKPATAVGASQKSPEEEQIQHDCAAVCANGD